METILLQGHVFPATHSSCLCHGEGPCASACPQSPVLGEHMGPAPQWMGLLQGRSALWVPEVAKCPLT